MTSGGQTGNTGCQAIEAAPDRSRSKADGRGQWSVGMEESGGGLGLGLGGLVLASEIQYGSGVCSLLIGSACPEKSGAGVCQADLPLPRA